MINKKFFKQLKDDYEKRSRERSKIIGLANLVLHDSKRVIFSLHRADVKRARELLDNVEKILADLEKNFGATRINVEGAYKAAAEEYVEAKMFYDIMAGQKIDKIKGVKLDLESLLGGVCDLTGELVRRAVNLAGEGKFSEVKKMKDAIKEIMAELVELDMTGYLRTKYDQAKTNLKKIEQISYEIKLRGK